MSSILRSLLVYIISFVLIFNPILISGQVYANLPTQNNLNDGHVSNMNSHIETTAGSIRVDGTTNTGLDRARNNVPIVNIATPSNMGVSKNNFHDFNVGTEGSIMNNSNQISTSKLGGALYANPNLDPKSAEARIILNEVTSTNRSKLYGATEIHGRRAEYILANPNGITCKGCGFINTPRVGLITGKSRMNNGDIEGFDISNYGDVTINGNNSNLQPGLNVWDNDPVNNVDSFDIVTRVAKINARIHAKELNIKTGNDYYNYKTKEITSKNLDENKPTVAIDSSALGGMYAGRIIMESTESGVGVNLGANVIADTNELKITSEGDIVYTGIASNSIIDVTSNEGSITQNSFAKAGGNLNITAENKITLNGNCTDGNCVQSSKDITFSSNYNVTASGDITIDSGIENNTKIIAQNTNLNTDKAITNNGEIIATDSTNQNNGLIKINSNKLFNSATGKINSGNNLTVNATENISNSGNIDSLKEILIQTDSLINSNIIQAKENNTLTVNNAYDITGTISTGGDLSITSNSNIINKTNLQTKGKTTIISNNGNFLNGYITNPTTTSNMQSATVYDILSDTGIEIKANNITNYGSIQTGGDLTLQAKENFSNITTLKTDGGNTLQANIALLLSIGNTNLYGNNITNSAGEILSLEDLTFARKVQDINDPTQEIITNATKVENISTKIGSDNTENNYISGIIDGNKDITFNTLELNNKGYDYDLDETGSFGYNINNLVYKGGWGNGYYNLMNQDQAVSTLKTRQSFITAGNDININNSKTINSSSNISAVENINITNGSFNNYHNNVTATNLRKRYGKHWTKRKRRKSKPWKKKTYHYYHKYNSYYNQTVLSSDAPTLIAGGNINTTNIEYFANGVRQTGVVPNGAPKTLQDQKQQLESQLSAIESDKIYLEQVLTDVKIEEQELINVESETDPSTIDKALIEKYQSDENTKITEFTNQKSELGLEITAKQTEVNNETNVDIKTQLQAELDYLITERNETDILIINAHNQKQNLDTKVSDITKYETDIGLLTTRKQAEDNLSNEQNTLANINTQLVDTSLTQAQRDDLNSQKSIAESNVTTYQTNLQAVNTSITNIGITIDNTKTIQENISAKTTAKNILISETCTNYKNIQSQLNDTAFTEELTAIRTRIKELEDAIKKNGELTTTAKNTLTSVKNEISSVSVSTNKDKLVNDAVVTASQNANITNSQNFFNISSLIKQAREDSNYLLETRASYISTDTIRGSFYFLDRIGYNPDQDLKVVGDPLYEAKLIQRQIQAQTGRRYLEKGMGSNTKQLEQLYDNSYEEIQRLSEHGINLTTGISLTKEQINNLQKDIVWLEKEQIVLPNGQIKEALVPKLYLANFDEDYLKNATIFAENIIISSNGDITNYGNIESYAGTVLNSKQDILNDLGIISSEGNTTLIAKNDVTNKGGNINSKNNLNINAGNNFNNLNQKETIGDTKYNTKTEDIIVASGEIASGGNMSLSSGNNINFIGTSAIAGGSMSLASQNQINILAERLTSRLDAVMSKGKHHKSRKERRVTNQSSLLQAGNNFSSTSVADTNITGSTIIAQGSGDIKSLAGDVNITNAVDSKMTHTIEKKKSTFSSRHDEVYDYKETAKESVLYFGNNLDIAADTGGVLVQGSSVNVEKDLNIGKFEIAKDNEGNYIINEDGTYQTVSGGAVENVNIKSAELKEEKWEVHKKSSFNPIGAIASVVGKITGSDALSDLAGPIYEKKTKKTGSKNINQHSSNIEVAGNLSINAEENLKIEGSNVRVGGSGNINANKVDITSVAENSSSYTKDKSIEIGELDVGFRESSFNMAVKGTGQETKNTTISNTQKQSNLSFGNNLLINTEGNTTVTSSNIVVSNNADVKTGGSFNLSDAKNTQTTNTENSNLEVEVGVKVGNAYVDVGYAAKALNNAKKTLVKAKKKLDKIKKLKKQGMASQKAVDLATTQVVLATAGVATAATNLVQSTAGAATAASTSLGTGMYVASYMNTQYSTNYTDTKQEQSVGSSFMTGNNISVASNNNIDVLGSIISSQNGDINLSGNEINIKASENLFVQESGHKSTNAGVSIGNNGVQISAGHSQGENNIIQTTHNNAKVLAQNGTFTLNSKKDTNIVGGNIEAKDVDMNVNGNLKVETVQDTYEEIGNGFGFNIGGSAKGNNPDSGGVSNVGVTMNAKDIFKKTTGEKSGIVATSSYNSNLSDSENLENLLNSGSVNVAGNTANLTEKEDTQFINADFEGEASVPMQIFKTTENKDTGEREWTGMKEIIGAYKNFGTNLKMSGAGLFTTVKDTVVTGYDTATGKTDISETAINFTENRKTFVTQMKRGKNARTRKTLNNASKGKDVKDLNKALKDGVKKGEENILYFKKGEKNKDGNLVRGFNDSNKQGYINMANGDNAINTKNLIEVDAHERAHLATSNEHIANSVGESAKLALDLSNWVQGDSINTTGGATQSSWNAQYNNQTSSILNSGTQAAVKVPEDNRDYHVLRIIGAIITGYTKHGINRAISRDGGRGVSVKAINDAVKNPKKVTQQSGGRTKFKGKDATVITNKDGKVITTYGKPRN
jgi:filamentous hemagglutinin